MGGFQKEPKLVGESTLSLGDHAGSISLLLDRKGRLLAKVEFTPFGEMCFGASRFMRESYFSKELDPESGLLHVGQRYFSHWLCAWTSPDPVGVGDTLNVYQYSRSNPVTLCDRSGKGTEEIRGVGTTNGKAGRESAGDTSGKINSRPAYSGRKLFESAWRED